MRSRSMSIIAPIMFFASLTVLGQPTAKYSIPEQWEYKLTECLPEPELNKLGEQGWELVAVRGNEANCQRYYLKRAKGQIVNITPPLPPPPKAPSCNLTLSQAPVIYGLRLGMNTEELLELFPRSKDQFNIKQELAKADVQYGFAQLYFYQNTYTDSKAFGNKLSSYQIGLFDGRVIRITANFTFPSESSPNWNYDAWIDKMSETFNLPTREYWSSRYPRTIDCHGFSVEVSIYNLNQTYISINVPNTDEIINTRRNAEYEKRRREFKP